MGNLSTIRLNEAREINSFTKVLRVGKGVIYLFYEKNNVTNSCFVEMDDRFFTETKPTNRVDLR
jgi:hypothetical protein